MIHPKKLQHIDSVTLKSSWRTGKSVSLLWMASSKKHGSQKRPSMEKRSSKQERATLPEWNLKSATN